ncbi:phosphotransferase [Deinococcus maricopensis]|uniref:Phosphotransferase (Aminonucleoside antibiotic resistance) n=1 Tax=Deinococcus maricopensis (strain DSM 21211 / LMG 22137 / NRRL B-23946 / LB-34) TaxID=709986 RepID=E8U686_DEIML|nr:phosphotransferase [Deinococcus maricopensis]ADV66575.1 phosphotransferase (aminonucleoside antibiotic resistance) [Deinococcus maricopensis DSM 21211]
MRTFIITGVPGTGKSSVCRALLQHFEFGVHVPVDDVREFVVSGIAHPVPAVTAETLRQFALARRAAGRLAAVYAGAGFAVALDDVLGPEDADMFELPGPVTRVLLRADLDAVLERNRTRTNKAFDPAVLDGVIRQLHAGQDLGAYRQAGWAVLDTTHLSVRAAVQAILALA